MKLTKQNLRVFLQAYIHAATDAHKFDPNNGFAQLRMHDSHSRVLAYGKLMFAEDVLNAFDLGGE